MAFFIGSLFILSVFQDFSDLIGLDGNSVFNSWIDFDGDNDLDVILMIPEVSNDGLSIDYNFKIFLNKFYSISKFILISFVKYKLMIVIILSQIFIYYFYRNYLPLLKYFLIFLPSVRKGCEHHEHCQNLHHDFDTYM